MRARRPRSQSGRIKKHGAFCPALFYPSAILRSAACFLSSFTVVRTVSRPEIILNIFFIYATAAAAVHEEPEWAGPL
jgi:hypothetical protein